MLIVIASVKSSFAQTTQGNLTPLKVNVLFGLTQPLLGGFNFETNLFYKRLAFDYSHGISLNFDNEILDETNQALGLAVHVPWTTGFGVGYRFNEWLNIRAEPKWHKFELYYDGDAQNTENLIKDYTTFSLGIGAYANLQPFKNQDNFLKGIMFAPSIRWWPKISSSLDNDSFTWDNKRLNESSTHEAMEVGVNNTPLIINVSVGYSFSK